MKMSILMSIKKVIMMLKFFLSPNKKIFSKFRKFSSQCKDDKEKKAHFGRHNYHEEVEGGVNQQILTEFNASFTYLSMSCYYGRTKISLPGCQGFFYKMFLEERDHAMEFIDYQLKRGGTVTLFSIGTPESQVWSDITVSLGVALEMEKSVKEKLECLLEIAEKHQDIELAEQVASKYIGDQNHSIREIARYVTMARKLVDNGPVGEHLFDKELFSAYVQENNKGTIHYK